VFKVVRFPCVVSCLFWCLVIFFRYDECRFVRVLINAKGLHKGSMVSMECAFLGWSGKPFESHC
jgi:hypothetical protein